VVCVVWVEWGSSVVVLSCVNDPGSRSPVVRGPGSGYILLSLQRIMHPFRANDPMTRYPGGLGNSTSPRGAFDDRHVQDNAATSVTQQANNQ
jgi:hypothetical protein